MAIRGGRQPGWAPPDDDRPFRSAADPRGVDGSGEDHGRLGGRGCWSLGLPTAPAVAGCEWERHGRVAADEAGRTAVRGRVLALGAPKPLAGPPRAVGPAGRMADTPGIGGPGGTGGGSGSFIGGGSRGSPPWADRETKVSRGRTGQIGADPDGSGRNGTVLVQGVMWGLLGAGWRWGGAQRGGGGRQWQGCGGPEGGRRWGGGSIRAVRLRDGQAYEAL